jgi:ribosomal protein S18 acetylase RimI-like enzyme
MILQLTVEFEALTELDATRRQAVELLAAACALADGCAPYIKRETHLNADRSMAAWQLAWLVGHDGQRLLCGAAGVFAPARIEVEISAAVLPAFRRQGLFSIMYSALAAEATRCGAAHALLVCNASSVSGAGLAMQFGARREYSELLMAMAPETLAGIKDGGRVRLVPADRGDSADLVRLTCASFGDDPRDASDFVQASLADPQRELFLIRAREGVVGLVGLTGGKGGWMIHGLGIDPSLRGRGLGAAALDACLMVLRDRQASHVSLEVAETNTAALRLYRARGFETRATIDYWRLALVQQD